ncbi:MAG: acylphosphatase [Chloroflexaceae bacterium]|nr:acylphosphatase [Chloroflexaceae bacterium]
MERVRTHVVISGHVQGVNFRAATCEQARRIGIVGWVQNLPDGRVEAMFEGPRTAVHRLLTWCYSGPSNARVHHVEVTWIEPVCNESQFMIRY